MNMKTELLIITGCKSPMSQNGLHNFLYSGFDNPLICFNCAEDPQFMEAK